MVSYAPDRQNQNFTHMYSFVDYRGTKEYIPSSGTVYDMIYKNSEFSKFRQLVDRANMKIMLDKSELDCTIIICKDKDFNIDIEMLDIGSARQILNCCILNKKLNKFLLKSSPVAYYYTRNPEMRLYITNISDTTRINNCYTINEFDLSCNNGIIHVASGLIVPSQEHFMN